MLCVLSLLLCCAAWALVLLYQLARVAGSRWVHACHDLSSVASSLMKWVLAQQFEWWHSCSILASAAAESALWQLASYDVHSGNPQYSD